MEEKKTIKCPCGQTNHLVFLDGGWHYEESLHGNGEVCEGKCFNCHAPLRDDDLFPSETSHASETTDGSETAEGTKEVSMSMTRNQLLAEAEKMGLDVPPRAKKKDIFELILQAGVDEVPEPPDE